MGRQSGVLKVLRGTPGYSRAQTRYAHDSQGRSRSTRWVLAGTPRGLLQDAEGPKRRSTRKGSRDRPRQRTMGTHGYPWVGTARPRQWTRSACAWTSSRSRAGSTRPTPSSLSPSACVRASPFPRPTANRHALYPLSTPAVPFRASRRAPRVPVEFLLRTLEQQPSSQEGESSPAWRPVS